MLLRLVVVPSLLVQVLELRLTVEDVALEVPVVAELRLTVVEVEREGDDAVEVEPEREGVVEVAVRDAVAALREEV